MKTRGLSVRHVFDPAPFERSFRFNDGSHAASLADFHERLAHLPAPTIGYHQEHFAPWVREVVGDEPLARRIAAYAEARPEPGTLRDILRDLVERRLREWREVEADAAAATGPSGSDGSAASDA